MVRIAIKQLACVVVLLSFACSLEARAPAKQTSLQGTDTQVIQSKKRKRPPLSRTKKILLCSVFSAVGAAILGLILHEFLITQEKSSIESLNITRLHIGTLGGLDHTFNQKHDQEVNLLRSRISDAHANSSSWWELKKLNDRFRLEIKALERNRHITLLCYFLSTKQKQRVPYLASQLGLEKQFPEDLVHLFERWCNLVSSIATTRHASYVLVPFMTAYIDAGMPKDFTLGNSELYANVERLAPRV